jgi:hypothetical protein
VFSYNSHVQTKDKNKITVFEKWFYLMMVGPHTLLIAALISNILIGYKCRKSCIFIQRLLISLRPLNKVYTSDIEMNIGNINLEF